MGFASNLNNQSVRQMGSAFIFSVMIVSAIQQMSSGHAKAEWDSMNGDQRYYLPMFKSKSN